MRVYEIRIDSTDDTLKERVARMLCPDENHPPPCPVPWSFGYADDGIVLAICAGPESAAAIVDRVRVLTPRTVTLADGDPADHEELVEQGRFENTPC